MESYHRHHTGESTMFSTKWFPFTSFFVIILRKKHCRVEWENQYPYEQDLGCSFFFSFQMIKTINWMNGKHSLNNQSSSLKRIMLIMRETHLRLIMQSFFHVLGSNKIASVVNQLASPTLPEVILPTLCLCSTLPCCFYERHAFNHPLQSTASIKHFASLPTSVQGLANHFLSFIDLCTLHNDSSVTCVSE